MKSFILRMQIFFILSTCLQRLAIIRYFHCAAKSDVWFGNATNAVNIHSFSNNVVYDIYNTSKYAISKSSNIMIFRRYIINPYMSEGGISNYKKRQFSLDLQRILVLITGWLKENERSISNPPTVFEAAPIATSFSIVNLLKGVRDIHLTKRDKYKVTNIIHSSISNQKGAPVSGNDVISNYDRIIKALNDDQHSSYIPTAVKIVKSISSGVPDAIYLANAGLNLGKSPLLDNNSVFVIQSPLAVERQVETAFTRALSIQMGSFPIEMRKVYEGMADSVAALVTINGEKKKVLLGFNSSRSDPTVYKDIVNLAEALQVRPEFPKDVFVLNANEDMKDHAYHLDVALLTLPNSIVCVGEGT